MLLCLFVGAACNRSKENTSIYNDYQFDKQVMEKIPTYDSLVHAILENYPLFQSQIKEDDSYRAYRYMLNAGSNDLFKKLPSEKAIKINQYFTGLGEHFIYGFDLFKDSSIKIYIRSSIDERDQVTIRENLSYYPSGTNIRRREFPVKDTVINKNWQYWIAFDERKLF